YEKGNIEYLSDEYLEMAKHTVAEAKRLGMEVSFNFGGPGWVIGGDWVPQEDRSKNLVPTQIDLKGPIVFDGPLPTELAEPSRSWEHKVPDIQATDPLVAVVAGRIEEGRIDPNSLVVLSDRAVGQSLRWEVPEGEWRLMAFWLKFTGQGAAVDHFDREAMIRYCEHVGGRYESVVGEEFGKTVDSFFCDSFEVSLVPNGIYWSTGLMEEFATRKGYDLTPYLPAVWQDMGEITPKIRYDVNEFLHEMGLEAFFDPFIDWCEEHGIKGRIQPYGFTTDNIEAAGRTHIPEMEITAGEKDAVPWFDTRIGPKKYVSSGAHLYGRNIVTTEAYTYLHWRPFRSTLEELKIASDIYFRTGCNKIYHHGYVFHPERDISLAPSSDSAMRIDPTNVWWDYYPHLSSYLARCCHLLRQGHFTADIAVYSPLANQWTKDVLNARRWTRDFDWGSLGKLLVANGYDFDLLNDDTLQNRATVEDQQIWVGDLGYKIILLPNIEAAPLETLQFIEQFVREGGVAIALERVPDQSVGLADWEEKDEEVRDLVEPLFTDPIGRDGVGEREVGRGWTYYIKKVIDRSDVLDWRSSALDPFIKVLRHHVRPDFGIDFARAGIRENNGLTFVHRVVGDSDLYFVTNIQDRPSELPITFRVEGKVPSIWNPYNGEVHRLFEYKIMREGTEIPLRLAPYESTFIFFDPGVDPLHVSGSNLLNVGVDAERKRIDGVATANGAVFASVVNEGDSQDLETVIDDLPAPFILDGPWNLVLESPHFSRVEKQLFHLESWTDDPQTESFSGTGLYQTTIEIPKPYLSDPYVLSLDFGKVGQVAEAFVNGESIGVHWMRDQVLDLTGHLDEGPNDLRIEVTNTLINRVSHLTEPPPLPPELEAHYGKRLYEKSGQLSASVDFEPLPASGLMGPVRVVVRKGVELSVD
ncbi:MAG: hypothetical protein KC944_09495, partial [Candidatus Omnitrophica bacterium]|nr:hypothetical protein [Candidatus Omnitrophota bacterium]